MTLPGWTREPLVHFLLLGIALFLFFAWKGEPVDPASRTIAISQEDRARIALTWERTMQRPPTDAELDTLTETWLREEILYREALRLGLDRDDAVVRKRLANKMDFLASSIAETAQPSDQTLRDWLEAHPQRFADDTTYSFDQLYFAGKSDAAAALERVRDDGDWSGLGQVIDLPATREGVSSQAVEKQFGIAFFEALQTIEDTGEWSGPVASGFGWHLVRLRDRAVGTVPAFEDIRDRVENDWRLATLERRKQDAYQLLRDAYEVTVEK
ncbi:peptidylprolyl isomerase [Pontixanthobacter aestiaquae]|uniref:Parvulin-like PPIase n=1 Tax=Pontixanthobacter aestiaquae TaxID=1509367 RepID=A0A844Z511_9SPHN|nr:peptidylprolyl isomerase [Pontixanthobacter aestiaquae]MDN3646583.1 peptidylprolyl isomerase [Pontixanthobacter aestiaquae]MXO82432.1 peptidyl-prolyl cis-trans isomerase [Pontixanthobacter aestiaquae]